MIDSLLFAMRHAVRKRILYLEAIVVDRGLQWYCRQDGWEGRVVALTHVMLESTTPVAVRAMVARAIEDVGQHLSPASMGVLQLIDEVAQKHVTEAN